MVSRNPVPTDTLPVRRNPVCLRERLHGEDQGYYYHSRRRGRSPSRKQDQKTARGPEDPEPRACFPCSEQRLPPTAQVGGGRKKPVPRLVPRAYPRQEPSQRLHSRLRC